MHFYISNSNIGCIGCIGCILQGSSREISGVEKILFNTNQYLYL